MGAGVACVGVLAWFTALTVYDVRQRRLPNALTLPGAAVVLAVALATGRGAPALIGALALALFYLAVHLVAPAGMGAGDVKLAIGVGALTGSFGVDVWVLAAMGAPVLTAIWAVAVAFRGRAATVPHGPSMCAAAAAAVAIVII
ncbi:MAG: leader peptidase (prepilin peptidase) / N-methyltransferase [Mycobacterium sp.]|jgi:leader peptidase (prepilin peptidase)/N-methyltransferase|nr:leader peptidase (prepilin peptidase) / N-methyltransferase [Mycobacterium sp.]MDT5364415.1 leader peptidase (prepilin peptidase) / N-methyltransferase [Mycobacterium sp.]